MDLMQNRFFRLTIVVAAIYFALCVLMAVISGAGYFAAYLFAGVVGAGVALSVAVAIIWALSPRR